MKKILIITAILILAVALSGCGNMSMGVGNFEFNKIHIDTYNHDECFTIEKWYDNSTGIEVKTKEAGYMYFAEGNYILIKDDCPFCNDEVKDDEGKID